MSDFAENGSISYSLSHIHATTCKIHTHISPTAGAAVDNHISKEAPRHITSRIRIFSFVGLYMTKGAEYDNVSGTYQNVTAIIMNAATLTPTSGANRYKFATALPRS